MSVSDLGTSTEKCLSMLSEIDKLIRELNMMSFSHDVTNAILNEAIRYASFRRDAIQRMVNSS